MIIPSYSLTATERILPRLDIDFLSGALDARIAVSRALNTATRTNASGNIEIVNADLPRFDYNPTTLAPVGLLVEAAATNLYTNSNLSGGVSGTPGTAPTGWTQFTTGTPTVTYGTDSEYSAGSTINVVATFQRQQFAQSISVSANTTYCVSVVIDVVGTALNISFTVSWVTLPAGSTQTYLLNGAVVGSNTSIPAGRHTIAAVLQVAGTAGTSSARFGVGIQNVADGNVTFRRPQVEANGFRSSYIPTTTAGTVTRNADVMTMTGTNFSDWWQVTTGGISMVATQRSVAGTSPIIQFDDATANNIIALRGNTTNPELYIKTTTDQAQIDAGTLAANTQYDLAAAWNTDNCAAAVSGGAAVTDLSATIPTVTQARLGSDGTNYLNGWLQRMRYWPQRITNAEVQAFSKL